MSLLLNPHESTRAPTSSKSHRDTGSSLRQRLHSPLRNQQGAVLLYVLFVLGMLLVLTPIITNLMTSRAASDITQKNQTIASQMTFSALETAVAEWNASMAERPSLQLALSSYNGWTYEGAQRSFVPMTLPDGTKLTHSQLLCTDAACSSLVPRPLQAATEDKVYYVRIRTVAGDSNLNHLEDERQAREQTITKAVTLKKGGIEIVDLDDPNTQPVCYPIGGTLLYGESTTKSAFKPQQVREAIVAYMNQQTTAAQTTVQNAKQLPSAVSCEAYYKKLPNESCKLSELTILLDKMDKSKPRYVKVKRISEELNGNLDDISSPSQPVVLIVDQLLTPSFKDFTIYGDIIVTGEGVSQAINMTDPGFKVTVHPGKDSNNNNILGNFYVMNSSSFTNRSDITVSQGHFFVDGDISLESGPYTIQAKKITVSGVLKARSTPLNLEASSGNITLGGFDFSSGRVDVTSVKGDLFVKDNFSMASGHAVVKVEGVIAVGKKVDVSSGNDEAITAKGIGSSLRIPGATIPCS